MARPRTKLRTIRRIGNSTSAKAPAIGGTARADSLVVQGYGVLRP